MAADWEATTIQVRIPTIAMATTVSRKERAWEERKVGMTGAEHISNIIINHKYQNFKLVPCLLNSAWAEAGDRVR